MADVEAQFKAALEVIQSLPKNGSYKPSPDMMLHFYSLYKQATEGKCNRAKPWAFDVINKAKWDAWNKLGNMPKEEAMKNYVFELTKIMKNFPIPTEDQIIEVLPTTEKAANFIETLGNFYQIVDPDSKNAKELKKYAESRKPNGNHHPISNGDSENRPANGTSTPDSEGSPNTSYEHKPSSDSENEEDSDSELGEIVETNENIPSTSQTNVEDSNSTDERTGMVNDSEDEFCDTSAEMTNLLSRHRDNSGSQSVSTLSSTSLNASPSHVLDQHHSEDRLVTKKPRTRGGERGTHGVDDSVQHNQQTEQISRVMSAAMTPNYSPSRSQGASSSRGGGSGGDRNPSDNNRQSEVQERIAVALLQLQRDMHSVLNRLTTLETITIARHQDVQHCHHCCMHGSEKKSWWIFEDLNPKTTLFILVWPFLARLLAAIWTKTKSRHRH